MRAHGVLATGLSLVITFGSASAARAGQTADELAATAGWPGLSLELGWHERAGDGDGVLLAWSGVLRINARVADDIDASLAWGFAAVGWSAGAWDFEDGRRGRAFIWGNPALAVHYVARRPDHDARVGLEVALPMLESGPVDPDWPVESRRQAGLAAAGLDGAAALHLWLPDTCAVRLPAGFATRQADSWLWAAEVALTFLVPTRPDGRPLALHLSLRSDLGYRAGDLSVGARVQGAMSGARSADGLQTSVGPFVSYDLGPVHLWSRFLYHLFEQARWPLADNPKWGLFFGSGLEL